MSYCFMHLRRPADDEGWEPAFPENVECGLIADARSVRWGIYEYRDCVDEDDEWEAPDPVSHELAVLISSGKGYPPALALARDAAAAAFHDAVPTRDEFVEVFTNALQSWLSRQSESGFVLARAVKQEVGYLSEGEWVWVLRVSGTPPLASWVSDDFYIYCNPASDFDLTEEQMESLRRQSPIRES